MTRYGRHLRDLWPLDPAVNYLNHGGYGVTPHEVLKVQAGLHARIERNPTQFMTLEYPSAIREAAAVLARFVGASADDLVFIDNATSGCNAVLQSQALKPGDEILVTNLTYGAVTKAARYAAARVGATVVTADIPIPAMNDDDILAAFAERLSERTRIAVVDHIVSPTGLLMPVRQIAALVHEAGARVLVDGAHVPGHLPLNVTQTGADWYVANCHKWLFAPRACGFLWASGTARDMVHPLSMSHGYGQGFAAEFDWTGTRDPTAFLSVPAAIAFHERLGGRTLMDRNMTLAHDMALAQAEAWGTEIAADDGMTSAMVAIRVPERLAASAGQAMALRTWLSTERATEVALGFYNGAAWLRIAAQAYNAPEDYALLCEVLKRR
jgi:isopenicillin-N epimerase